MLSSIGRAALKRSGAGAGACQVSTNRVAQHARLLRITNSPQGANNLPGQDQLAFQFLRCYATATKVATKAPSKTTKSKSAGSTTKAKKPAKKVAKKPKAVKKPAKKVLTDKQRTAASIRDLKAKALTPPPNKPSTVWQLIFQESMKSKTREGGISDTAREAAAKYKSLSPAELETYNHKANQNKLENEAALKKWVETHTPEEIRIANNARTLLKRKLEKPNRFTLISDPRMPKRPINPYLLYVRDKMTSGDFKGIKTSEAVTLISNEWRALSPSQKKPYEDRALVDADRYAREFKTAFHRDPPSVVALENKAAA
ncbi:uncharacterized protein BP5553_01946 [Venustampulla echinocandica]|uniref:HMG box domain-containing protein n=1 Tax=Venustampulla echinocandica TaxID=2656787 RepID=A0A370U2G3_9HELO|nr:uncharacterized protein BP5553_01946 [Venustampulla echinocandica]RDL41967.1 hypothetical protein BP5553_01946 [Venustampulla echinocandica]